MPPASPSARCSSSSGLPEEEFNAARPDLEAAFLRTIDNAPELAARVRAGTRVERLHTATDLRGYFRKPYGPGWALVGDAGYHLHPITAQGITDAFLDAERLTDALDAAWSGRSGHDDAMSTYQTSRDEHVMAMYEMTFGFAQIDQPPPPEMQHLLGAIAGNQPAMDDFVSVQAGTLPIPQFFHPRQRRPHHGGKRSADLAPTTRALQSDGSRRWSASATWTASR